MNELIGTVTLAYVEEDNRQRAIFRLIPLCTKDGFLFHGTKEEFPDEGSLRIVPDKREQGTFKDRMRGLCGVCAILLPPDGKDKMKIRSNRNYNPENGENNRNAVYSDVIHQFLPDGCFEIIEAGKDFRGALTQKVLLQKDMLLYGPISREQTAEVDVSTLKPFGNDSFLLHMVDSAVTGKRKLYWNPDMLSNWRQYKTLSPKKEKIEHATAETAETAKKEAVKVPLTEKNMLNGQLQDGETVSSEAKAINENKPSIEEKSANGNLPAQEVKSANEGKLVTEPRQGNKKKTQENPKKAKVSKLAPEALGEKTPGNGKSEKTNRQQNKSAQENPKKVSSKVVEEGENVLPIGKSLNILDQDMSFDQQLSRLTQPLSEGANRLNSEIQAQSSSVEEDIPEEETEKVFRPAGTELKKDNLGFSFPNREPVNVFRIVEKAIRSYSEGTDRVTNPISCLKDCVDAIWQDDQLREQAIQCFMENGDFMSDILSALRKQGSDFQVMAAAEEQLSEIEAERLELLMQLRLAKENEKEYQKKALENISHKRRDEAERLKKEIERLRSEKNRLTCAERVLSTGNQELIQQFVLANANSLMEVSENRLVVSPVIGEHYDENVLAENLRINMNNNGFSISEDDAQAFLICFGLFDTLCLSAETEADATRFASLLIDSLGLRSVSAILHKQSELSVVNMLPKQENRTPTVSVQLIGSDVLCADGHKNILVSDSVGIRGDEFSEMLSYPVLPVPLIEKGSYFHQLQENTVSLPAALSSFTNLEESSRKLLSEAEKWFDELHSVLIKNGIHPSQAMMGSMRRFVATASNVLRGGFPLVADFAVCLWIVPVLSRHGLGPEALEGISVGLTKSISMLSGGNLS